MHIRHHETLSDMSRNGGSSKRLAIADPPYLGRSRRWYGQGHGHSGGRSRAAAHPEADQWDDPATHRQLVTWLEASYDGWGIDGEPESSSWLQSCR